MVAGLVERGELTPPWRPAMEQVARHRFVPDLVWEEDDSVDGPDLLPLRRADDPDRWLRGAYANTHVTVQVNDGYPDANGRGEDITSTASQPAVVADMLAALEVEPGMTVLEIGTGTGWNAALLAHRLGAENVVSIEVDPALADAARKRLASEGFGALEVVTGDGALGVPARAPYDRVLATVAAPNIPYPWVAQVRPGGTVLLPWGSDWYSSALLRLVVGTDGSASGRIVGGASFMLLRTQRRERVPVGLYSERDDVVSSHTDLHPWPLAQPDAATAIGLRLPGCKQYYRDDGDIGPRLNIAHVASRSWARVYLAEGPPYTVEQQGPRMLWDEAVDAYRWWQGAGEPAREDWLVTVDGAGQRVELTPAGSHRA